MAPLPGGSESLRVEKKEKKERVMVYYCMIHRNQS